MRHAVRLVEGPCATKFFAAGFDVHVADQIIIIQKSEKDAMAGMTIEFGGAFVRHSFREEGSKDAELREVRLFSVPSFAWSFQKS